jgi:hypothetical protein
MQGVKGFLLHFCSIKNVKNFYKNLEKLIKFALEIFLTKNFPMFFKRKKHWRGTESMNTKSYLPKGKCCPPDYMTKGEIVESSFSIARVKGFS